MATVMSCYFSSLNFFSVIKESPTWPGKVIKHMENPGMPLQCPHVVQFLVPFSSFYQCSSKNDVTIMC